MCALAHTVVVGGRQAQAGQGPIHASQVPAHGKGVTLDDLAGLEGSVIVREVAKADKGIGYDAATNQFVDMIEEGIIDPTKVTRSAIQNAASIAGMFLTTEVAVAELPEAESAAPAGMGGGMPMM